MPRNSAVRKFSANMSQETQEEIEQKLMNEFIRSYGVITERTEKAQKRAQGLLFNKHKIKDAREVVEELQENVTDISKMISNMGGILKKHQVSPSYHDFLVDRISTLKTDRADIQSMQKEMHKSEKCGAKELDDICQKRDFWTNACLTSAVGAVGVAATMTTTTSGQFPCLTVLTTIAGFSLLFAAKSSIANYQYNALDKAIEDGEYICNSIAPQRPGTRVMIQVKLNDVRKKISKGLHLTK